MRSHRRIDWFDVFFWGVATGLALITIWVVFFMIPVSVSTQIACYEAGYPKYDVTINLKGYCLNVDGAVTGVAVPVHQAQAEFDPPR